MKTSNINTVLIAPTGSNSDQRYHFQRERLAKRLNGIFERNDVVAKNGTVYDWINHLPPNPTAFLSKLSSIAFNHTTVLLYQGPIRQDEDNFFLFTDNSKSTKSRSLIHLEALFSDNIYLELIVAEDTSQPSPIIMAFSREGAICRLPIDSPDSSKHQDAIIDTYLNYAPYLQKITASDLINLRLAQSSHWNCEDEPVKVSNVSYFRQSISPSSVLSALEHNLLSSNSGSREDGINELQYFRARVTTADEANRLNQFFAACDSSKNVRCAAGRVQSIIRTSSIRTLKPKLAELSDNFLQQYVDIPAGEFTMGSDPSADQFSLPEEQPSHKVWIDRFKISIYPVTVLDWSNFKRDTMTGFSADVSVSPRAPATHITWYEALEYCSWLTLLGRSEGLLTPNEEISLPSEAQWEKAARGTEGRIYPWGNQFVDEYANYRDNGPDHPIDVFDAPKGSESPFGVFGMAGNVWEWTRSLWGRNGASPEFDYPYDPNDGRENLSASGDIRRVVRGGAWYYFDYCLRCSTRNLMYPYTAHSGGGFRTIIQLSQTS